MAKEIHYVKMTSKEKAAISNQLAALFLFRDVFIQYNDAVTFQHIKSICKEHDPLHLQLLDLWKKWEKNCIEKKWNFYEWYKVMLVLILRSFTKAHCCFDAVRDTVRVYINAEKRLYRSIGIFDTKGICPLVRQDWDHLGNSTIAAFLMEWIITQPEMRQSIYQFARNPFNSPIPPDDLPQDKTVSGESGFAIRYNALRDAYRDIEKMHFMRKLQIDKEGTEKTYFPYYEEYLKPYDNEECLIPYTTLCAMDFIANSKLKGRTESGLYDEVAGAERSCLRIFKYISQRQNVFRNPSDRGKNNKIAVACADYAAVLNTISEWGEKAHLGDIYMAKKYVIASIMAIELEESHRLYLANAAAAASRRRKKNMGDVFWDEFESEIAYELIGRIPIITRSNTSPKIDNKYIAVGSVSAFNFLRYRETVEHIYSTPPETAMLYSLKICLLRNIQSELISLLLMLFSTKDRIEWTYSDFQVAANFLYEKYNVVDALRKIPFPELELPSINKSGKRMRRKKDHYDRMREFFRMMQSWETQDMDQPMKESESR